MAVLCLEMGKFGAAWLCWVNAYFVLRLGPILLLCILLSGTAAADQSDPRLQDLFKRLSTSPDEPAAQAIEREIWAIWLSSGNAELDHVLELGQLAMANGDLALAIQHFTHVIERAPGFAEGWNKRATAYYLKGELTASMQDVRQTLALEPRHFGAISGIGLIFLSSDDLRGALEAFERVLSIHPYASGARRQIEQLRALLRDKSV